jgi:hypothetical protein
MPNRYGERITRRIIAASTVLAGATMAGATALAGTGSGAIVLVALAGLGLAGMAAMAASRSSARLDGALYKLASVYMLAAMLTLAVGA